MDGARFPLYDSLYEPFIRCCEEMGIDDADVSIGKMLTVDYIIANEDRHFGNFGFIRNAETLEWMGLAPIYDSGSSLWYNSPRVGAEIWCKPFEHFPGNQMRLVKNLEWFDADALKGIDGEIHEIFSIADIERIDEQRRGDIAKQVVANAATIGKLAGKKK
jgi:hypothetical protein